MPRIDNKMGALLVPRTPLRNHHHPGVVGLLRPLTRRASRQQQSARGTTGVHVVVQCGVGGEGEGVQQARIAAEDEQRPSDRRSARHYLPWVTAGTSTAAAGRGGWQEEFAALRNDAGDPWTTVLPLRDEDKDEEDVTRMTTTATATTAEPQRAGEQSLRATTSTAASSGSASSSSSSKPRPTAVDANTVSSEKWRDQDRAEEERGSSWQSVATEAVQGASTTTATATTTTVTPIHTNTDDVASRTVLAQAAEIMASRGESDPATAYCAYLLLDAELTAARGRHDSAAAPTTTAATTLLSNLTRSTAAALLSWIRCETAGNGLVVTDGGQVGTSDTVERQKMWAEHAPTVLHLVKEVGKDPTLDPEVGSLVAILPDVCTRNTRLSLFLLFLLLFLFCCLIVEQKL